MAKGKRTRRRTGGTPPGVWNRGRNGQPSNPIRVRTKRLDEIDSDKIALAYWLLAKQVVANKSDQRQLDEVEVRRVAARLEDDPAGETEHGAAA